MNAAAGPDNAAAGRDDAAAPDVRPLTGADVLARRGISAEPVPAPSERRFPDGAHYRIEIPSVEGPAVLRAVVGQASAEGIVVNRASQGSGAMLLPAAELAEMARIGADNGIEVSLFTGPREEWDVCSLAQSGEGPSRAGLIRGVRQRPPELFRHERHHRVEQPQVRVERLNERPPRRLPLGGREVGYQTGFIERYLLPLIYPAPFSRSLHVVLGLLVMCVNLAIYWWIWRRSASTGQR